eukprot:TRINITY_DN12669_c0_g1_i1.p1 TRINITY_DN12669_c0_g1~~TRINITY_DN12669_c0_g1_i1.p1  ORF type:complete len:171 (-),score=17.48 TRINITY_DN12669_c0_g1_i1:435-902(-)
MEDSRSPLVASPKKLVIVTNDPTQSLDSTETNNLTPSNMDQAKTQQPTTPANLYTIDHQNQNHFYVTSNDELVSTLNFPPNAFPDVQSLKINIVNSGDGDVLSFVLEIETVPIGLQPTVPITICFVRPPNFSNEPVTTHDGCLVYYSFLISDSKY